MNEDIGDLLVDVKKKMTNERHSKKGKISYCSPIEKDKTPTEKDSHEQKPKNVMPITKLLKQQIKKTLGKIKIRYQLHPSLVKKQDVLEGKLHDDHHWVSSTFLRFNSY